MSVISCLTWVKQGVVSSNPRKVKLDEEKFKQFVNKHNCDDETGEARSPTKRKRAVRSSGSAEEKRIIEDYGLDDYSDDDDEKDNSGNESDGSFGMSNLAVYSHDEQDPYLTKEDDEEEDNTISNDDNLVVVGKVDGDYFSLEAWVHNEALGNEGLYCHHEYILPSCPLTVEWVGGIEGKNLVAVGSLDASLTFWDLDVMDSLDPEYVIKGCIPKKSKQTKVKKVKSPDNNRKGHSDAILSLSWNAIQTNILASASADSTVRLWDLNSLPDCCTLNDIHSDKIQTLAWHPQEAQTLLTGSSDKLVKVFDCRSQSNSKSWNISGEAEKVLWHSTSPFCFFAGSSTGVIYYSDIRMDEPILKLDAAPGSVTDLAICNASSGNCLLSSSDNGLIKIWHMNREEKFVHKKNFKVGSVFCLAACPDSSKPLFALGGEREMKVCNLAKDSASAEAFGWTFEGRVKTEVPDMKEKSKVKKSELSKKKKGSAAEVAAEEGQSSEFEEKLKKIEKKKAKTRMIAKKNKAKKSKAESDDA